jgi:hypothetical protein
MFLFPGQVVAGHLCVLAMCADYHGGVAAGGDGGELRGDERSDGRHRVVIWGTILPRVSQSLHNRSKRPKRCEYRGWNRKNCRLLSKEPCFRDLRWLQQDSSFLVASSFRISRLEEGGSKPIVIYSCFDDKCFKS